MLPRAGSPLKKLVVFGALLASAPAFACGFCVDAGFRQEHWWATALPLFALVLIIDAVVTWRLSKQRLRILVPVLAVAGGVVLSFLGGGSVFFFAAGALFLLAPMFLLSIVVDAMKSPRLSAGRALVVGAVVALGLASTAPGARDDSALLAIGRARPHYGLVPGTWVVDELKQRPDGTASVEAGLDAAVAEHNVDRATGFVQLHTAIGGDANRRAAACAFLATVERKPWATAACTSSPWQKPSSGTIN